MCIRDRAQVGKAQVPDQADDADEAAFDDQAGNETGILRRQFQGGDAAQGTSHDEELFLQITIFQLLPERLKYDWGVLDHACKSGPAAAFPVAPVVCHGQIYPFFTIERSDLVVIGGNLAISMKEQDPGAAGFTLVQAATHTNIFLHWNEQILRARRRRRTPAAGIEQKLQQRGLLIDG